MTDAPRDDMRSRPDADLLARLRAAGEQERARRAPATLQARLEHAYATHRAAVPAWRWPRIATACAVLGCVALAASWSLDTRDLPGGPPLVADATNDAASHAAARAALTVIPSPSAPSASRMRSIDAVAAPGADAERARTVIAGSIRDAAISAANPVPTSADTSLATSAANSVTASVTTSLPGPPAPAAPALAVGSRLAFPAVPLDPSTLHIATTAPALPSFPLRAPAPQVELPLPSPPSPRADRSHHRDALPGSPRRHDAPAGENVTRLRVA